MIEKVVYIKNVGRFSHCCPSGDQATFKKLSLILAENGRGKTTICAILRSLQANKPELVLERNTLGASGAADIHLRISNQSLKFSNDSWSSPYPDISIFDSTFVHENVYAGDFVDVEHKRNLYRVIVGAQGVALAQKVDEIDESIRNVNSLLREKKEAIQRTIPKLIGFEEYLKLTPIEDLENKIRDAGEKLQKRKYALNKANEITQKKLLEKVQLPEVPKKYLDLLAKQITDIMADAELRVKGHIDAHNMGRQGEAWLSQGLGFVKDDTCPFCSQDISGSEIITAYRSHFNAAYLELKKEVATLKQSMDQAVETSSTSFSKEFAANEALVEFWKQFVQTQLPELPTEAIGEAVRNLRTSAAKLTQLKEDEPAEAVHPGDDFNQNLARLNSFGKLIEEYNSAVEECNALIKEQKAVIQDGGNIQALQQEADKLLLNKGRFEAETDKLCQEYQASLSEKQKLELSKETAKHSLDQYCETTLQTYETSINKYLDKFSAEFRIVNASYDYRGGSPRSVYQIQINNTVLNIGDSQTPAGTPCFKNTLSAGDRNSLALAFFLAAIELDAQRANKIVVFDDPFTSLDKFRRTCTQQLIQQVEREVQQVIVLSHDAAFLYSIWDSHPTADKKVLRLIRTGKATVFSDCDIKAETQSIYHKNYATLLHYANDEQGNPLDVVKAIRPFLEGMLRSHFPGHFPDNIWLGQFIEKIRNADDAGGLAHAKADLPEIEAINEYSKTFHHDNNAGDVSPIIDPDELRGFVRRTLRLVGDCT